MSIENSKLTFPIVYAVYTVLMALLYFACGYLLAGNIVQASIVGVVLGYWVWKWTVSWVINLVEAVNIRAITNLSKELVSLRQEVERRTPVA